MPARLRTAHRLVITGANVVAVAMTASCAARTDPPPDGLGPDIARVRYGARSAEVPLTACGQEGQVVVLAGREGNIVLQAQADLGEEGFDRSGVTVDLGDEGIVGAFGADMDHGPAGEITDVRVEGDRVIIEGTWVALDDDLDPRPSTGGAAKSGEMVARCPDRDDEGRDDEGGGDGQVAWAQPAR